MTLNPLKPTNTYKIQIASDVNRDGLGVELIDLSQNVRAEVFRSDRDHTVVVTTFGNDIPLLAIEELLERARVELDPFEDGTPLSQARISPFWLNEINHRG